MRCVLDTNVLIYFLDDALEGSVLQRVEQAMRASAKVSVMTRMEVLGWQGHTAESRARARALLDQLDEIALTSPVVERVIEIRSSVAIKLPDAIIAASAMVENLSLMTRNIADFERVPGLVLVDPFAA
jgi:predicted nucleic acid-binding protein